MGAWSSGALHAEPQTCVLGHREGQNIHLDKIPLLYTQKDSLKVA